MEYLRFVRRGLAGAGGIWVAALLLAGAWPSGAARAESFYGMPVVKTVSGYKIVDVRPILHHLKYVNQRAETGFRQIGAGTPVCDVTIEGWKTLRLSAYQIEYAGRDVPSGSQYFYYRPTVRSAVYVSAGLYYQNGSWYAAQIGASRESKGDHLYDLRDGNYSSTGSFFEGWHLPWSKSHPTVILMVDYYKTVLSYGIVVTGGAAPGPDPEPDPTYPAAPHNTYILMQQRATWEQARQAAEQRGGHLATITSPTEWNNILGQLGQTLLNKSVWLGGSDASTEGAWRWVTGEPWSYSRWAPGQPNNNGGAQHFLQLWGATGANYQWDDNSDTTVDYYLLERAGHPALALGAAALDVGLTGASGYTLDVGANLQWTAAASAPWITITGGASGLDNGRVTFNVLGNDGAARSGAITLSGGGLVRTLNITQAAGPAVPLAEALDAPPLNWSTGGHTAWFGQAQTTSDGADAAQCGTVTQNQHTWIETTVTGPGVISFWWQASCAPDTARLGFYVDSAPRQLLAGQAPWQRRSFPIPAGNHALKWQYARDAAPAAGADRGWVDQVQWRADGGHGVVYRFWSPVNQTHFFTQSKTERDFIMGQWPDGWHYEGLAWYAYPEAAPDSAPVHRFWSPVNQTHFFTISEAEKDYIIAHWPTAWTYEGVAWYAHPAPTAGATPVYRFYSPVNATHFFTISEAEKDYIIANWRGIWTYEGIAYYAPTTPVDPLAIPAGETDAQADDAPAGTAPLWNGLAVAPVSAVAGAAGAENETAAGNTHFPLAYDDTYVTAAVYDPVAAEWNQILPPAWAPAGIDFPVPAAGRRYWLTVLTHDAETASWTLEHGSWFGRLSAPPATEPTPILDAAPAALGLPIETISLPAADGPLTVGLYCPIEQRDVLTLTGIEGGSHLEVTIPAWNRWYRLEVRAANGELLEAAWLGHLRTH
ncbi:MAG: hypothetical protein K9N49_04170 [Candidatus Marinimicrobia bacterium]|nr:hypothetical protein [Candidatus Neomarinimicrobiota bacterium]